MENIENHEIPLATKKGNRIINDQQKGKISTGKIEAYKKMMKKFPLVKRKGYSSEYNCHGMTFASRRTGIYDPSEINKIITEDEYVEIVDVTKVLPGDIAIYFQDGEVSHSAIVVSESGDGLQTKRVVSKWSWGEEIVHWERDCPYGKGTIKYFRVKLDEINS